MADEDQIITPNECYEHFVDIVSRPRPSASTSEEMITEAYVGIILYHVGVQLNMLSNIIMEGDHGATEGQSEAE